MRAAIIPARGGSVRLPRKNIRDFRGKPMLLRTIETAQLSGLFDQIIVSTDDEEIAQMAMSASGTTIHARSPDDGSKGTQAIARDVLMACDPDSNHTEACVIYPCSPLLTPDLLCESHRRLTWPVEYVVSVQAEPLTDAGCFYWGIEFCFRAGIPLYEGITIAFPLPADRVCDINTWDDFHRAETMYDTLQRIT